MFIDRACPVPPVSSIGQNPHFYQPDHSLPSAGPLAPMGQSQAQPSGSESTPCVICFKEVRQEPPNATHDSICEKTQRRDGLHNFAAAGNRSEDCEKTGWKNKCCSVLDLTITQCQHSPTRFGMASLTEGKGLANRSERRSEHTRIKQSK